MKRLLLVLLLMLWTGAALAQQPTADTTQSLSTVTRSDVYCSGFITNQTLPRERFVTGGQQSPNTTRFAEGDYIFLKGNDYQPGMRVSIVRALRDPNQLEAFEGQHRLIAAVGQQYADEGYARIIEIRGHDEAVAQVEFSCDPIVPGDTVQPFVERPMVKPRIRSTQDLFPPATNGLVGRIVDSRDFNQYVGTSAKVYLDIGSQKGVRLGQYFRVVRGYTPADMDIADRVALSNNTKEPTQKNPPELKKNQLQDLPLHLVGEIVVLSTTPSSATAMVTFSVAEIQMGDRIELEEGEPAPVVSETSAPVTPQ
jgi:hypothetical protein